MRPLIIRSALGHPFTVVAGTTYEGDALAFFNGSTRAQTASVVEGKIVESAALASVLSAWAQSTTVLAGTIVSPLFARSAWSQPATVMADTKLEGNIWPLFALSTWEKKGNVLAGTPLEGALLVSVLSVGVGLVSH